MQGSSDAQAPSLGPGLARRSVLKRPVIAMPADVLADEAETACPAPRGSLWVPGCVFFHKQKREAGLWWKAAPLRDQSPRRFLLIPRVGAAGT